MSALDKARRYVASANRPKLTINQLIGELKKVEAHQAQRVKDHTGDPNPQVRAMLAQATARLELVRAIIRSAQGDQTDIRLFY